MIIAFAVALGGAIGSVARYLLDKGVQNFFALRYPLGILSVNVIGCLIMGFLATLFIEKMNVPHPVRAFLLVGILGGFTTF